MARSLVHTRGGGYEVHDMVLDFAKFKIKESTVVMEEAALLQAQYLGRPEVLCAYSDKGQVDEGLFSLISLWRSLEELSGNELLEIDTYKASLGTLEMTIDVADTFHAVAGLFQHQVCFHSDHLDRDPTRFSRYTGIVYSDLIDWAPSNSSYTF